MTVGAAVWVSVAACGREHVRYDGVGSLPSESLGSVHVVVGGFARPIPATTPLSLALIALAVLAAAALGRRSRKLASA